MVDSCLDKKFQLLYGKAVCCDPEAMKKAVIVIYYHSSSTNLKPLYNFCPEGPTSMCKHRWEESQGGDGSN